MLDGARKQLVLLGSIRALVDKAECIAIDALAQEARITDKKAGEYYEPTHHAPAEVIADLKARTQAFAATADALKEVVADVCSPVEYANGIKLPE